ncbi:MAG: hypothetical protein VX426_00885 [Chloroflexota bacterium]|nr:hypothetical protein [Chloroflexota bacterium]
MGTNYWMFVETEENASITRRLGYKLFGMGPRYRKRAQRMQKNDRVLFYTRTTRRWTASATIKSKCFEDDSIIWMPESRPVDFKFRVELDPNYILDETQYLDGLQIGPGLEYVKRWAPENWPLAFWDKLHLLPQRDFKLLEGEMIRVKTGKPGDLSQEDSSNRNRNSRDIIRPKAQFTATPTTRQTRRITEAESQDGFVLDENSQPN